MRCAMHQLHFHLELIHLLRKHLHQARIVDPLDHFEFLIRTLAAGSKQQDFVAQQVIHATESLAHADRPGNGGALDLQYRFDFIEQFKRIARFAIHLVHERQDRRGAHAAHVQQLDRLLFDALGGIDHHQGRIDCRQHAIGIFRKILVSRRIEQVHDVIAVVELHHRARDGNAALLFDFHPVRRRMTTALASLHGTGELDCTGE